jgi:membrane fusion protein (multidrug efflux system)
MDNDNRFPGPEHPAFTVFSTAEDSMRTRLCRLAGGLLMPVLTFFTLSACNERPAMRRPPAPTIPYMVLSSESVVLTAELPGRVSAFTVSEVRPQVGGIIVERLFEEGSQVIAGQALYQIDPVLYRTAYNNAEANLAVVRADEDASRLLAKRLAGLVRTGAAGRQQYDDAAAAYARSKAEIKAAEEALETARINLSYTTVTAPIGGRIGRSAVTVGALVTQNQENPLAVVRQISPVYVDITQSNADLLRLRRDRIHGRLRSAAERSAGVKLHLEDGTPYTRSIADAGLPHQHRQRADADEQPELLEGELLFSETSVDRSTGVVALRARFDNPEGVLLPGMYVRAVIEEGVMEKALTVPQRSVTRNVRNRPQVFVLTRNPDGNAPDDTPLGEQEFYVAAREIIIERDYENKWLVSGGPAPGDLLVLDGLQHIRPGMRVVGKNIAEPMPPAPAASPVGPGSGPG